MSDLRNTNNPFKTPYKIWANEMAQWAEVIAAKSDDLSSTPRTHMVEGKI